MKLRYLIVAILAAFSLTACIDKEELKKEIKAELKPEIKAEILQELKAEEAAQPDPHELKTVEFWIANPNLMAAYNSDNCSVQHPPAPLKNPSSRTANCKVIDAINGFGNKKLDYAHEIYEKEVAMIAARKAGGG